MKSLALTALALACLAGCSTFDADFEKAKSLNSGAAVEGAWSGRWQSNAGHGGGELRAIVTPDGKSGAIAADKTYIARFKAQWAVFTTEYSTPITAHSELKTPNTATISADADVGFMLGRYTMEGTSTPSTFTGNYKAAGDNGTIDLKRP